LGRPPTGPRKGAAPEALRLSDRTAGAGAPAAGGPLLALHAADQIWLRVRRDVSQRVQRCGPTI